MWLFRDFVSRVFVWVKKEGKWSGWITNNIQNRKFRSRFPGFMNWNCVDGVYCYTIRLNFKQTNNWLKLALNVIRSDEEWIRKKTCLIKFRCMRVWNGAFFSYTYVWVLNKVLLSTGRDWVLRNFVFLTVFLY